MKGLNDDPCFKTQVKTNSSVNFFQMQWKRHVMFTTMKKWFLIGQLLLIQRSHGQVPFLVHKIKQMKVVQLLCLLWILYLNTDVLGQTQRGDINGNTRNNELRYGRGQGNKQQIF